MDLDVLNKERVRDKKGFIKEYGLASGLLLKEWARTARQGRNAKKNALNSSKNADEWNNLANAKMIAAQALEQEIKRIIARKQATEHPV